MGMRAGVWIMGVALAASACGGSSPELLESVPTPASSEMVASASTAPPTTVPATSVVDSVSTTQPDEVWAASAAPVILAIGPALLPDDAFPPPWEPQWRQTDVFAFGAGPNQTDCDPYWIIEELRGGGGGHAMWWIDGANANHYVSRIEQPVEGRLRELASLQPECPVVSWGEGGSFTVESIALDDGLGFRFTEIESRETTWIGLTTYGDLISILDVPTWGSLKEGGATLDFGGDDLNRLVTQMSKLLRATPELSAVPTTTLPGTRPPQSTQPRPSNASTTTTTPTTTTMTPRATTTTVPPAADAVRLLLDASDLPPEFADVEVRAHTAGDPDVDMIEACPAAISIERIDQIFEVESEAGADVAVDFGQLAGRAESAQVAIEVVEQFAEITACDLSSSFGAETATSGGMIDLAGSNAAARLTFEDAGGLFTGELVLFAVGNVISAVSVGSPGDDFDPALATDLAVRAVKKIVAASS